MINIPSIKTYDSHIVGYYGMKNSGDDALMHATIWGAKHLLACKSNSLGSYQASLENISVSKQIALKSNQYFPGQNRLTQYKAAAQSKRIIFGGGSVLHSETDINLKRHLIKISGNNESRAVGVSLGPFQSTAAEQSCAKFLQSCHFVGVRDQHSFDLANELAPHANVKKTFDLAPLLLLANTAPLAKTTRKGIALSLCPVAINPNGQTNLKLENERINEFCHLVQTLYDMTGETITLLTFNGHSTLGDWKINQLIANRLSHKISIDVKPYNPNPFVVLNDLTNYKAIISMRLHGAILGYLAKTPVLSVNYHQKCQGWCEEVGMHPQYQFNANNLDMQKIIKQVAQGLAYGFIPPTLKTSAALDYAQLNWSTCYE